LHLELVYIKYSQPFIKVFQTVCISKAYFRTVKATSLSKTNESVVNRIITMKSEVKIIKRNSQIYKLFHYFIVLGISKIIRLMKIIYISLFIIQIQNINILFSFSFDYSAKIYTYLK
jgi:hypothetical protein